MSEPTQTETDSTDLSETDSSQADDSKKNPHLIAAIKARDVAKKRAADAEARARELEAREAEREAERDAAQVEQERKKNDFAALEKRLQKERDDARKEAADAKALVATRERSDREAALVDAVMPKLGITNRIAVKGVLRALADSGLDIAPESIDESTAADVAKQVQEALGDLYQPRSTPMPGSPGVNLTSKKPGEKPDEDPRRERARELGRRYSQR